MLLFTSFVLIIILLIGAIACYFIQKTSIRTIIIYITLSTSLIGYISLLFFSLIFGYQESIQFMSINQGNLLLTELILFIGLIIFRISRIDLRRVPKLQIFDSYFLVILISLILLNIFENLLLIFIIFLFLAWIFRELYHLDDYEKSKSDVKRFLYIIIISSIFGCTGLAFLTPFTLNLNLDVFQIINLPDFVKIMMMILFTFSLGALGGLFPFTLFHLKKYFQNNTYTSLFLYSLFLYISYFVMIKILTSIGLELLYYTIFLFIVSFLGVFLSSIYILIELLTPIDGQNYSIKKLFGFSIVADINMFLLMNSLIGIIPLSYQYFHLNTSLFFLVIILFIKFFLSYLLIPVINETNEDNLKLLGGFRKYKIFGFSLVSLGVLAIITIGGIILFNVVSTFILNQIISNSLLSLISFIHISSFIFYLLIFITYTSSLYVHLFLKKKAEHLKFEKLYEFKIYDSYPIYILFLLVLVFTIVFVGYNEITILIFSSFIK